jgi:hypothetical protein
MVTRKTNRGAPIDFDALMAQQNPSSRALGNMGVNAKGDKLGDKNQIVQSAEDRVRSTYAKTETVSSDKVSLKGESKKLSPDTEPAMNDVKTAKTASENVRTSTEPSVTETVQEVFNDASAGFDNKDEHDTESFDEPTPPDGENFDEQQPLGYKEVELPNGDIEMVPYYREEDAP